MNVLLERQLAGWAARYPESLASMPDLGLYLKDGIALNLLKVCGRTGANPVAISDALLAAGIKIDPGRVNDEVLQWSEPQYITDPRPSYEALRQAHVDSTVVSDGESFLAELKAGKIDRATYFQKLMERYAALGDLTSRKKMSTREWAIRGREISVIYKKMAEEGLLLYMPRMWPQLRTTVGPMILGTLICVIGPAGGGKTIFSEQMAYEWAASSGNNVLYANTELTNEQMMWRYIVKFYPVSQKAPAIQDLQMGYWDDICDDLVKKFSEQRGTVTFMESSGISASDLVIEAAARNAHLIVDYADMLSKPTVGRMEMTETLAVAEQMTVFKNYAQRYGRIVVVVQQVTKSASSQMKQWLNSQSELEGEAAMGSARYIQRSNLMLSLNVNAKAQNDTQIRHPITGKVFVVAAGEQNPEGYVKIVKSTFGQSGRKIAMFLDGAGFRLLERPS